MNESLHLGVKNFFVRFCVFPSATGRIFRPILMKFGLQTLRVNISAKFVNHNNWGTRSAFLGGIFHKKRGFNCLKIVFMIRFW